MCFRQRCVTRVGAGGRLATVQHEPRRAVDEQSSRRPVDFPRDLKEFRERLDAWRRSPGRSRRVPEDFWQQALALGRVHWVSTVAGRLGLSYTALKNRFHDPLPREAPPHSLRSPTSLPPKRSPSNTSKRPERCYASTAAVPFRAGFRTSSKRSGGSPRVPDHSPHADPGGGRTRGFPQRH